VRWTDNFKGACKTIANLEDLSPGGVSLLLDRPLRQGTRVEFSYSGQTVTGNVCHCTCNDIGWMAGVRFAPDSQWDPMAYPPEHLLDPKAMPEDARLREGPHLSLEVRGTISCLVLSDAVRREEG
jgi:hypothetical protein